MNQIINKISLSGIKTIDLSQFKPNSDQLMFFDIKQFLKDDNFFFEQDFKNSIKSLEWSIFTDCKVSIGCSNDALVPYYIYPLIAALLYPFTKNVLMATPATAELTWWRENLKTHAWKIYNGQKVVLKASNDVPPELYVLASTLLLPVVQSLMWGEAGSPYYTL